MVCASSSSELEAAGDGDKVRTSATARRGVASVMFMAQWCPSFQPHSKFSNEVGLCARVRMQADCQFVRVDGHQLGRRWFGGSKS